MPRPLGEVLREIHARAQAAPPLVASSVPEAGRVVERPQARRPVESAISEGNLAENPLFVLTNEEARPLGRDGQVELADYERVAVLGRELVAGQWVERRVTAVASPQYGFPTMFSGSYRSSP